MQPERVNPFEETDEVPQRQVGGIEVVLSRRKQRPKTTGDIQERGSLDELPKEHEIVQKYCPRFLGKGGENLVYEVDGRSDLVIKAMKQPLAEQLAFNTAQGLDTGEESFNVDEMREVRLKRERERYQKLRDAFGDHVLPQKFFVIPVPVGKSVLEELKTVAGYSGVTLPQKADAGWTIASIQKRAHVLDDKRRMSLTGGNLEAVLIQRGQIHDQSTRDRYRYVTDQLMSAEQAEKSSVNEFDFIELMAGSGFASLLKMADRDPGLAEALTDFQKRAVQFSVKNEDILDIIGKDNIVFHRDQDGAWTYTIIDGLYPFDTNVLRKGREALLKMNIGIASGNKEQNAYLQSVNYVRIVNGLGKILKTGSYIDFLPEELKENPEVVSNNILGKDKLIKKA